MRYLRNVQDFEQPEKTQNPYDSQNICRRKKNGHVHGQYSQQIDNSIKAKDIFQRFLNRDNSQQVFDCKENGNDPFAN